MVLLELLHKCLVKHTALKIYRVFHSLQILREFFDRRSLGLQGQFLLLKNSFFLLDSFGDQRFFVFQVGAAGLAPHYAVDSFQNALLFSLCCIKHVFERVKPEELE